MPNTNLSSEFLKKSETHLEEMLSTSNSSSKHSSTESYISLLTQGHPFNDDGRKATFNLLDVQRKGTLDLDDLRYLNEQFRYGFSDDQLVEIIHAVGCYGTHEITSEKFNRFVLRKIEKRRI